MRLAALGLLLTAMVSLQACSPERSDTVDLGDYQWQNRLLLVFAPSAEHPALIAMQEELREHAAGVLDRDLIVFTAEGSSPLRVGETTSAGESASVLREQFGVPIDDYAVILIGKDGGEKLRGGADVRLRQVFGLIDTMPMRRREMEERGQS